MGGLIGNGRSEQTNRLTQEQVKWTGLKGGMIRNGRSEQTDWEREKWTGLQDAERPGGLTGNGKSGQDCRMLNDQED